MRYLFVSFLFFLSFFLFLFCFFFSLISSCLLVCPYVQYVHFVRLYILSACTFWHTSHARIAWYSVGWVQATCTLLTRTDPFGPHHTGTAPLTACWLGCVYNQKLGLWWVSAETQSPGFLRLKIWVFWDQKYGLRPLSVPKMFPG